MTSDAVETAAQLIHQRHRAGTANVCGECRDVARQVAEVLASTVVCGDVAQGFGGVVLTCSRPPHGPGTEADQHRSDSGATWWLWSGSETELMGLRRMAQRAVELRDNRFYADTLVTDAAEYILNGGPQ